MQKYIKIRVDEETSVQVQSACFEAGIMRFDKSKVVESIDKPYLYVENKRLLFGEFDDTYDECEHVPMTPKEFIAELQAQKKTK